MQNYYSPRSTRSASEHGTAVALITKTQPNAALAADAKADEEEEEGDPDDATMLTIMLTIVTLFFAIAEAIDLELLAPLLLLPFMAVLKLISQQVPGFESLDPAIWMGQASKSANTFAKTRPVAFLVVDFGSLVVLCALILFWSDLRRLLEVRRLDSDAYEKIDEEAAGETGSAVDGTAPSAKKRWVMTAEQLANPDGLRQRLRVVTDAIEEHDLMSKLRGSSATEQPTTYSSAVSRSELEQGRRILERLLFVDTDAETDSKSRRSLAAGRGGGRSESHATSMDFGDVANAAMVAGKRKEMVEREGERKKKKDAKCAEYTKTAVNVLKNAANGIATVPILLCDDGMQPPPIYPCNVHVTPTLMHELMSCVIGLAIFRRHDVRYWRCRGSLLRWRVHLCCNIDHSAHWTVRCRLLARITLSAAVAALTGPAHNRP